VLGGGITSSGGYDSSQVNAAYPADGSDSPDDRIDDAWRGYIDASVGVTMTLRIVCLQGSVADGLKYRARSVRVPAHTTSLAAPCPNGYQVTGGGVTNSGVFDEVELKESRPAKGGEAWKGTVRNVSNHRKALLVYAICANGRVARHLSYRHSGGTAPAGNQASEQTNCPGGSGAIAAGVRVKANNSNVNSFQLVGPGTTSYVDAGGLSDVKWTNYAVCLG
jgi:hypothetical protein